MNTIFKFYNQAWVLYAVASAASLYYFMARQIPGETEAMSQLPDATSDWRSPSRAARHGRHLAADNLWHTGFRHEGKEPWQDTSWSAMLVPASAGSAARFAMVNRVDGVVPPEFQANIDAEGTPVPSAVSAGARKWVRDWLQTPLARPLTLLDRRPIWGTCFLLLLVASFVYTYAGTQARENYRTAWLPENSVPFTLDGMAFMKVAYPADYAGISWLNSHVRGAPVIVEDNGGFYDWRSRVSMFTGLPSVTNGIHEGEQRFADELNRGPDVQTLYDSTSIADAQSIIRKYGIRYIYVGFSERQDYSPAGLAKFNAMVGHGLTVAFHYRDLSIYRVTRP
jgi:hypothetical protein